MAPATPDREAAQALDALRAWAESTTGASAVHDVPARPADGLVVVVHPLGLRILPDHGRPAHTVSTVGAELQVLLTVVGGGARAGADLVTHLALTALADGREIVDDALAPEAWQSLGLPVQPGLVLAIPIRRTVERGPVTVVREPLQVEAVVLPADHDQKARPS